MTIDSDDKVQELLDAARERHRALDWRAARELAQQALERAEQVGWERGVGNCHLTLGSSYRLSDQPQQALDHYRSAFEAFGRAGRLDGQSMALKRMGYCFKDFNDHAAEISMYEQALELAERSGNQNPHAHYEVLVEMAHWHHERGNLDTAMRLASEVLEIARQDRKGHDASRCALWIISDVLRRRGDLEAALDYAEQGLRESEIGNLLGPKYQAILELSAIHIDLGNYSTAFDYAREAVEFFRTNPPRIGLAKALTDLGKAHEKLGRIDEAIACCLEAVEIHSERDTRTIHTIPTLQSLGRILTVAGRYSEAIGQLNAALELVERLDARQHLVGIHIVLSEAWEKLGDPMKALEHYRAYRAAEVEQLNADAEKRIQELVAEHQMEHTKKENEILRLRSEQLQTQLDAKQRELASQAMHLARQTELLARFRNDLRAIVRTSSDPVTIVKDVKEKLKELPCEAIDWTKFEAEFQDTYPDFRDRLLERWPDLSKTELRICALLKLKLTSSDIARLTCLSERTVEDHRYRIRRKIGLEQGKDLHEVLAGI